MSPAETKDSTSPNKGKDGNNIFYIAPENGNFDPVVMKMIQPYYKGPTTTLGVAGSGSIYGQASQDKGYVVANHRGYLYAQQAGVHTFSAPITDDVSLLWVGANA
jgi:hypothetical protein